MTVDVTVIETLQSLLDAATPGEPKQWVAFENDGHGWAVAGLHSGGGPDYTWPIAGRGVIPSKPLATYIAAATNALPDLLAEIRHLRGWLEVATEALEAIDHLLRCDCDGPGSDPCAACYARGALRTIRGEDQ